MSYQVNKELAIANAGRLVCEGKAEAVKSKVVGVLPEIEGIVRAGIPVMGHLGLLPQSLKVGGFKVQGKTGRGKKTYGRCLALQDAEFCHSA